MKAKYKAICVSEELLNCTSDAKAPMPSFEISELRIPLLHFLLRPLVAKNQIISNNLELTMCRKSAE